MSAATNDNADRASSCIACLEPIRHGASKCPHCGSSQAPPRWHNLGQVLKWIGGIVTVVTLLGGLITLNSYYQDWRERRDAVAEIVAAADWLIRAGNYRQAWKMYAQAAELNPSSETVRHGRFRLSLLWVRNFSREFEELDRTLTDLGEALYRGLPNADAGLGAEILAHIGYIQVLRQINRLPLRADAETLFEQAFAADPGNVYANAMYARWLSLQQPPGIEKLAQLHRHFQRALESGVQRDYVRQLQLLAYRSYNKARDSELEVAGLKILVETCIEMIRNGEGLPPQQLLRDILRGYENLDLVAQLEPLLASLPVEPHLEAYQRLLQANQESLDDPGRRSTYILARLHELAGERDAALERYWQMHDQNPRKKLTALIDRGIERLTGRLPERASARGYIDDPVDASNPFQFHLDTLENFEPTLSATNLEQALAYFSDQVTQNPQQLTALELSLPTQIERVRETVAYGDYIENIEAWSSGFSRYDHTNARRNWVELVLLHARLLEAAGQHERALAQVGDVARTIGLLDDDWRPTQARLDYEMARLHALLAAANGKAADREHAITLLQSAVAKGITDGDRISWRDIKAAPFALLAGDERYRELVRGR